MIILGLNAYHADSSAAIIQMAYFFRVEDTLNFIKVSNE